MAHLCGCYYYLIPVSPYHPRPRSYLPLLNSSAHTTILSTASTTILKQTFTNPSPTDDIKECVYTFPLYDGVSVVGFTCKIGDKTLTGLVKEKVKAKKIFDEAVSKGETAGLLEQSQESSDVFSTKLGNIPASQSVIVEITYIGELKHHETEGIRFTIPTSIAPRYGDSSAPASSVTTRESGGIEITVDVNMPEGSFIKGVQSPSHPIAVSMGTLSTASNADPMMSKASATLSLGSAALEKDFVLIVHSKDVGIPKAFLETHPTIPNHRAIMATLVPKFSLPPSRPEIVFLADRSGSMHGTSINMLKSAMKVFLKSIPTGVKFNIGSFGTHNSFLFHQSKSYTSETLQESLAHVDTFEANMGGTETFSAVRAAIERRYTDLPLEIILLTDGDIWQQNELFEYVNHQVAGSQGKIRIFPLGIGNGVSHSLIEGLARAGNGFAQAVQFGERLDNSVVRMLRGALSPHITNYTLEVKYEQEDDDFEVIDQVTEGLKVLLSDEESSNKKSDSKPTISLFDPSIDPDKEDVTMKDAPEPVLPKIPFPKLLQAPHKIPSLFAFSRTTVYLLMSPETIQRNPTSVILRATSDSGPLELQIPIEALSKPGKTIHQLAAKKTVQDLEEGRGWIFDAKDQAGVLIKDHYPSCFDDLVKRECVRLGETFQVAGKWCSFVAVAANDKEIAAVRERHQVDKNMSHNADVLQDFDFDSFLAEKTEGGEISRSAPKMRMKSTKTLSTSSGNWNAGVSSPRRATPPSPSLAAYQQPLMTLHQQPCQPQRFSGISQASTPFGIPQSSSIGGGLFGGAPVSHANSSSAQGLFGNVGSSSSIPTGGLFGSPQSASSQSKPMSSLFGSTSNNSNVPLGGAFGSTSLGTVPSYSAQPAFGSSQPQPPPPPPGTSLKPAARMQYGMVPQPTGAPPMIYSSFSTGTSRGGFGRTTPSAFGPASTTSRKRAELGAAVPLQPEDYSRKWMDKSSADKVLGLIELQEFEGSWPEGNQELVALLGFQVPPSAAPGKIWVTMLVVCFLEIKNSAEEGTWGMIVEKARGWLTENVPTGLDDLEKAAVDVINKN